MGTVAAITITLSFKSRGGSAGGTFAAALLPPHGLKTSKRLAVYSTIE